MSDLLMSKIIKIKKTIYDNKIEKINLEKKLKTSKITEHEKKLSFNNGFKEGIKTHFIQFFIKVSICVVIFAFMKDVFLSVMDLDTFIFFIISSLSFSFLWDILFNKIMIKLKLNKNGSILLKIDSLEKKNIEFEKNYKDTLLELNIIDYQKRSYSDFNDLPFDVKDVIKDYIELINSEDAKLFNLVKNEKFDNFVGMKNY